MHPLVCRSAQSLTRLSLTQGQVWGFLGLLGFFWVFFPSGTCPAQRVDLVPGARREPCPRWTHTHGRARGQRRAARSVPLLEEVSLQTGPSAGLLQKGAQHPLCSRSGHREGFLALSLLSFSCSISCSAQGICSGLGGTAQRRPSGSALFVPGMQRRRGAEAAEFPFSWAASAQVRRDSATPKRGKPKCLKLWEGPWHS